MHRFLAVAAFAAISGTVSAQSVEFRFVERTGRTAVTGPGDAELNLAVQARVVGGTQPYALGEFSFDVHIVGEPESNGTLSRGLISNVDHTYATTIGTSAAVGRGGVASQYAYLAGINPSFNGVINLSSGTFTNGPDQEIGLVTGSAFGQSLLNTPGLDADADGNPDTWIGNGSGTQPASNTTAPLDPSIGPVYFGTGGAWIDVYRFRYTVTNFPARTLVFRLESKAASVCPALTFSNGTWGMPGISHPAIAASDLSIPVTTSGMGSCCDGATGACTITSASGCTGVFLSTASCTPSPCPPVGRCCDLAGVCTFTLQTLCNNVWDTGATCTPNPCPRTGSCCASSGICTTVLQSLCTGVWNQTGSCVPNHCPLPGACCTGLGGCTFTAQAACTSAVWMAGSTCVPNPCVFGACCTVQTGCSHLPQAACVGGIWISAASCSPSPCVLGGCCDPDAGACTIVTANGCPATSVFLGVSVTCGPYGDCPMQVCCNVTTHGCSLRYTFDTCPTGAVAQGVATTCVPSPCPGMVCCNPTTGACSVVGPSGTCPADRINLGPGTACNLTLCPVIACCNGVTGACSTVGAQGTCPTGTVSQGANTSCGAVACPVAACCSTLTGACSVIGPAGTCPTGGVLQGASACTTALCPVIPCCNDSTGGCSVTGPMGVCPAGTTPHGAGTTCAAASCPPPGRCCDATGACSYIIHTACVGTWTTGVGCSPNNPCPQPGRCCTLAGDCTMAVASACTDIWSSAGSCTPNICSQYGACCHEGFCSIQLRSACLQEGLAAFRGYGIACGTTANPIGCCYANFNMVNGVDIQDLNDFLSAWFAHDAAADFDHDGTLTITDVTRFINAWTAGCH